MAVNESTDRDADGCRTCGYPVADLPVSAAGYIRCPECGDRGTLLALTSRPKRTAVAARFLLAAGIGSLPLWLVVFAEAARSAGWESVQTYAFIGFLISPAVVMGPLTLLSGLIARSAGEAGRARRWRTAVLFMLLGLVTCVLCWVGGCVWLLDSYLWG